MEGVVHHRLQVGIVLGLVLVLTTAGLTGQAHAKGKPFTDPVNVTVNSHPSKVTVEADTETHYPGTSGVSVSGGSHCWLQNTTNIGEILWPDLSAYPTVKVFPFFVWCDGQLRGLVFLEWHPSEGSPIPAGDPRTVAMRIRDQLPIPGADIAANPNRGLVGVRTWFWITGYDGSPLTRTTPAFGSRIQVRASPDQYNWDFGDGTVIKSDSPGVPYPKRSDVIHMYQRSSAGLPQGYEVQVTFVFSVSYRVNGGPWQALPGISRTAARSYPVQESQAIIQQ